MLVVGGGAGGVTVAAGAAQLGAATVLVERGTLGGVLDSACVPTRALIVAAQRAQAGREAAAFGLGAAESVIDYAAILQRARAVADALAPRHAEERLAGLGVRVVRASARFIGERDVAAGEVTIRARRIVIATGARPALPPLPGLEQVPFRTEETILDDPVLPQHLLVLGGGPAAVELAQAYRLLGARVSVLAAEPVLARFDPELVTLLLDHLRAQRITIRERAPILRVERSGAGIAAILDGEGPIVGSHLLLATERRPALDGLDLERAGIAADAQGLVLDRRLRTTNRRVYAVGDAAGSPASVALAQHHAGIVLRNALFRWPARVDDRALPAVVFTMPELAQVGLAEAAAPARPGDGLTILRWPFFDNDRAQLERATRGLVKLVARRDGRVLGAAILGAQASELIPLWALAIGRGLKLSAVAGMIVPYPTLGAASQQAAASFSAPRLFSERARRLVRLLARFG
jgi:pyruvate/2-oxoglutarate dehydrogenase complex dihydrolipoamide dehydrogenase (E3) component